MKEFNKEGLEPWEFELVARYPLIFLEGAEPGECNLRYGFEFGYGWKQLAEDFASMASKLVEHLRTTTQPDAFVHSFIWKEKFGSLTWQGDDNLVEPFGVLLRAYQSHLEAKSERTCEVCGKWAKIRPGGWRKALCDEHFDRAA